MLCRSFTIINCILDIPICSYLNLFRKKKFKFWCGIIILLPSSNNTWILCNQLTNSRSLTLLNSQNSSTKSEVCCLKVDRIIFNAVGMMEHKNCKFYKFTLTIKHSLKQMLAKWLPKDRKGAHTSLNWDNPGCTEPECNGDSNSLDSLSGKPLQH